MSTELDLCQHLVPVGEFCAECKQAAETKEPTIVTYRLVTDGKMPDIDRMAILIVLFNEMPPNEREAAVSYLGTRYNAG